MALRFNCDVFNCDVSSCDVSSCDVSSCDVSSCDVFNCDLFNCEELSCYGLAYILICHKRSKTYLVLRFRSENSLDNAQESNRLALRRNARIHLILGPGYIRLLLRPHQTRLISRSTRGKCRTVSSELPRPYH